MNRRTFLAALGLGGSSLFLPSTFRGNRRALAGGTAPKRLVVLGTQHGTVYDYWRMRPPGTSESSAWTYDLGGAADLGLWSPILGELHAHRDQLIVVDGVAIATGWTDPQGGGNEHDKGQATSFTGAWTLDGYTGGGPSVDQIVSAQIRRPDRYASLEFSAPWGVYNGGISYLDAGTPAAVENDPHAAFDRLFPEGSGGTEPTDEDRVRAEQGSVLDLVSAQYDRYLPRLGAEDRAKLALHRDLVRDLEMRLGGLVDVSCGDVPAPGDTSEFVPQAEAFIDLTVAALACDLTRVVSIQLGTLPNELVGAPPGDLHNDTIHAQEYDPAAKEIMRTYQIWQARYFKRLLDRLDAVPEGTGTMLDNTLVVWCGELANGAHSFQNWPVVMAGGGAGWQTGRYLYMPRTTPRPTGGYLNFLGDDPVALPHNRLLVSIARAFGVDTDQVGIASYAGAGGTTVNCRGTLEGLS